MHARIPEQIDPLLQEYLALLQRDLPGFVDALYVHGSICLDAFNDRSSDIDYTVVLSRPHTPDDLNILNHVHQMIARDYPRWPLEGSYIQWADLEQSEHTATPYLNYHDGLLTLRTEVNLVTWWLIKNRGIGLKGPEPGDLRINVDWGVLISRMRHNLDTYWARFVSNPTRMTWLLTDSGIQWVVLGVLRLWYTFREDDITSKEGAGAYALKHLPVRCHRLILESLTIRQQGKGALYRSRLGRAVEAWRFLRYVIRLCNLQASLTPAAPG